MSQNGHSRREVYNLLFSCMKYLIYIHMTYHTFVFDLFFHVFSKNRQKGKTWTTRREDVLGRWVSFGFLDVLGLARGWGGACSPLTKFKKYNV